LAEIRATHYFVFREANHEDSEQLMLKMLFLFMAYSIAPVVAGHGMLPMAWFSMHSATWVLALACGSLVLVSAAFIFLRNGSPAQLVTQLVGTLILYGAWLANILYVNQLNAQAERQMALQSMLIFSLPFQGMTAVVVYVLARQLKRTLSRA
jgi:hypothetical protein